MDHSGGVEHLKADVYRAIRLEAAQGGGHSAALTYLVKLYITAAIAKVESEYNIARLIGKAYSVHISACGELGIIKRNTEYKSVDKSRALVDGNCERTLGGRRIHHNRKVSAVSLKLCARAADCNVGVGGLKVEYLLVLLRRYRIKEALDYSLDGYVIYSDVNIPCRNGRNCKPVHCELVSFVEERGACAGELSVCIDKHDILGVIVLKLKGHRLTRAYGYTHAVNDGTCGSDFGSKLQVSAARFVNCA